MKARLKAREVGLVQCLEDDLCEITFEAFEARLKPAQQELARLSDVMLK